MLIFLALLPSAYAYSFTFNSVPAQCQDLQIEISGGAGQPPYSVLIIPFGPSPLPNNVEVRTIFEVPFNSSSTSFQLKYPANSEFVAVVSDSSGFGTGGTSVAATVQSSSDSSCFNATQNVSPDFVFSIVPSNQLVQCTPTRIWWDPSTVQGTPQFHGVIPGGQSFAIPEGSLTTVANEGLGFSWTPSVRTGTTLLLLGGDNRGPGTGGSGFYIMSQGDSNTCLNSTSPSSTPGSPAGGSYPTSTNGASTGGGGSGGSHNHTGAIVGGVIGGIAGVVLILAALWFFHRRQQTQQTQKERSVDLLQDHDHDQDQDDGQLPQYYRPEPFLLPEPTIISSAGAFEDGDEATSMSGGARGSMDRRPMRLSQTTMSMSEAGLLRPATPSASATTNTRKTPHPPTLRPVNIIQHDDAGPPPPPGEQHAEEPETIELPPAYTNIRRAQPPPPPEETD
ncbi:hypothetical protein BKA93DRAFT_819466 [Sparassis latifolia]|uniref:Mid2 domain-containing protein n=1 Tax=Sparassis crispa TaxID=139825 RepID=A0A401H7B0_9APHY|nr:hypothetical protein SCP_1400030 [Sparassis crispa]XP_027621182.1 hypothetical protein SCP_2000120 [Sparassis crispa]GBE88599.1 hypothetical protein SCP_1400030 [Sparassis crispa]GBE90269.1 hypothetical protein SCP_2000120 [Sparassis crispa]